MRDAPAPGDDMTVEIRPCRDQEELKAYGDVIAYVFASNDRTDVDKELTGTQPEWTMCAFADGRMATTLGAFPFTVRLNGSPVRVAAVTAVGTYPEFRRRGFLRQVMQRGFETWKEQGQSVAILWASMGAIYQRFGYGLASSFVRYDFDPRMASLIDSPQATGSISLMSKEDAYPIIKQLYIQYATPRNMHIHRSSVLWNINNLRPREKGHPVYIGVYRDDAGQPQGHVVYATYEDSSLPRPGPSQVVEVKDFSYLTMEAYRGLWEYLRRHDLAGRIRIAGILGEDDPAPRLLLEPRSLNRTISDGIWLRVVDVESALPQRPYGDRGELIVRVAGDDMCPWNEGTFLLETDGPTTAVRRVEQEPDITVAPRALASLFAGHASATELYRVGLAEARDDRSLKTADRLFATEYRPNCPNDF
ncbi:MAG: GNAT family N-acetyltransferase [Dehalococcoidia bacterium]